MYFKTEMFWNPKSKEVNSCETKTVLKNSLFYIWINVIVKLIIFKVLLPMLLRYRCLTKWTLRVNSKFTTFAKWNMKYTLYAKYLENSMSMHTIKDASGTGLSFVYIVHCVTCVFAHVVVWLQTLKSNCPEHSKVLRISCLCNY